MRKLALILLAGCLLLLSACGAAAPTPADDPLVARAYNITFTRSQLLAGMQAYAGSYGIALEDIKQDESVWQMLRNDFVNSLVLDCIITHQAAELGYTFTQQDQAAFEKEYATFLEQLDQANRASAVMDGAKGKEEIDQKLQELRQVYFAAQGYTAESYKEQQQRYYITRMVKKQMAQTLTASQADVESYYQTGWQLQKRSYETTGATPSPESVLFYPQGYTYVKALYLAFPSEVVSTTAQLFSQNDPKLEGMLNRETQLLQPTINEIRSKLAAGVSFDTLVEQYGQDDGMKMEPYKTTGYFTSVEYGNLVPAYKAAVEALQAVGDVQECVTYKGYWFLYAAQIVDQGPVPLEEVKGSVRQALLEEKQALEWESLTQRLLAKAKDAGDVEIYLDVLN